MLVKKRKTNYLDVFKEMYKMTLGLRLEDVLLRLYKEVTPNTHVDIYPSLF